MSVYKIPILALLMILVSALNQEFSRNAEMDGRFHIYILSIIGQAICTLVLVIASIMIIGSIVEV